MNPSADLPFTQLKPVASYYDEILETSAESKPEHSLEIQSTQQTNQSVFGSKRTKAIFFINMFAIMQFLFLLMSKQTMKWYSVDTFDFLVVRTIVTLAVHTLFVLYYGKSI